MSSSPSKPSFGQQLYALVALTLVSTAIGFTMKYSQVAGTYKFSPASCVVMTECFKLVCSVLIAAKLLLQESQTEQVTFQVSLKQFVQKNFTSTVFMHELGLAVAYSVVNIVTYSIFQHAPASMFFLIKAASPVVTAVMLRILVNRAVSGTQWFSITMQCVGLLVTQYNACTGSAVVSALGYFLIFVNVAVSCFAGVWNEHIIKNYGTSVNAQNIILYSCGMFINFLAFLILPHTMLGLDRPYGFFEGYNWAVASVVVASGSIGLVITAVYKYADVVVKTFGLAGSTVTLFLLEKLGILPASSSGTPALIVFGGAIVVFYAAYLYIAPALEAEPVKAALMEEGERANAASEKRAAPLVHQNVVSAYLPRDYRISLLAMLAVASVLFGFFGQSCGDMQL
ncbi:nucleotide-sugar transporter, putative [Bodo saltans]|uniref:Nucleotide-sugar transporter, putative n=1 Tax=Bodo saltans TaxID=75058 RepID=A0A0S4IH98_BODSA|nr:nucleotide-sugar transporter, putative [Bodo saltans]|eukprot:CUE62613.1 nucleotide-sugar transporter, putative [Bodo saltans]